MGVSASTAMMIRYKCNACRCENVWEMNEIRQRGEVVLLRGDAAEYDVYLIACQMSGCRKRRQIKLLREGG